MINGAYWGVYEVRESMNEEFIESHTGWNDFDMIRFQKFEPDLKEGTWDDWDYLRNFLENNDFSDEANYQQATELIDIDNLVNLLAFTQCSSYQSWSYGISTYKKKSANSKWKYTVWDMDKSHFLTSWNPHDDYPENTPTTWGNFLNKALTENETFRNKLVNRTADILNTDYHPTESSAFFNSIKAEIEIEMPREFDRWNATSGITDWDDNVNRMHNFLTDRPDLVRGYIVDYYNFPATNTINLAKEGEGRLEINTVDIPSLPWSGTYFETVPVPITAIAAPGYIFSGWSDPNLPLDPTITVAWENTYNLTAYFTLGSTTVADIVINEINYHSSVDNDAGDWIELYNTTGSAVDLSAWYFQDEGNNHFSIPNNWMLGSGEYLVLVEDSLLFQTAYPDVSNFIGNFGDSFFGKLKLNNDGEYIALSNADASYQDTVKYNDALPWPEAADGTGASLQLQAPDLDNALPENWNAFAPTPGRANTILLSQSINLSNISDQFTTATPFTITASASSGLPVTLSLISGPATLSGNTITLDGIGGTVVVGAVQAGNDFYNPAPSVSQSFEVLLRDQTISFETITDKLTTAVPFSLVGSSSSGLSLTYEVLSGPANVSGDVVTLDGVGGTVVVEASQIGSNDYNAATVVTRSFEVLLQDQTISFEAITDKLTTAVPFSLVGSFEFWLVFDL